MKDQLDKNGYAPSIIPGHGEWCCWACKQNGMKAGKLDRHEVFHEDMGGKMRERSKMCGLWVYLCHDTCHQGPHGVHADKGLDLWLKQVAQRRAMETYGWTTEQFVEMFGKNYLEEDYGEWLRSTDRSTCHSGQTAK